MIENDQEELYKLYKEIDEIILNAKLGQKRPSLMIALKIRELVNKKLEEAADDVNENTIDGSFDFRHLRIK
jgi:hypothetical protein